MKNMRIFTPSGVGSRVVSKTAISDKHCAVTDTGYLCLTCGSHLKSASGFRTHYRDMHQDAGAKYSCPKCNKIYRTKNSFANHMSMYHKNLRGLDIEVCRVEGQL